MNKARISFLSILIASGLFVTPITYGSTPSCGTTDSWDKVKKLLLSKPALVAIGCVFFYGVYKLEQSLCLRRNKQKEEDLRLRRNRERESADRLRASEEQAKAFSEMDELIEELLTPGHRAEDSETKYHNLSARSALIRQRSCDLSDRM